MRLRRVSFDEEETKKSRDYRSSGVEELYFFRSFVHHATIEHIIASTKSLKRFTYRKGDGDIMLGDFAPRAATEALLKYAADSLEELVFTVESDSIVSGLLKFPKSSLLMSVEDLFSSHVCLRGFKKLKTLRCPWKLLHESGTVFLGRDYPAYGIQYYNYGEEGVVDLTKILPHSLEFLHIDKGCEEVLDALTMLLLEKETCFPNLKAIYVKEYVTDLPTSISIRKLIRDCISKGIEYKLNHASRDNLLRELMDETVESTDGMLTGGD